MANTVTTPNMSLELPIPTVQIGPDYAENNNSAFTLVDSHTHIPGQGLPVPTAGLSINADLTFNSFNAIALRSSRFTDQTAVLANVTDLSCLYSKGGELYYNDQLGNHVRITVAGAVDSSGAGSISGMGATTAAVTYSSVSSLFTFTSNTNTPAKLSIGPLTLGRNTVSPFTVTITPSASQASNYNLTLPIALPASTSLMACDSSGQLSAPYTIDGTTLEISSNIIQIKDSGVSTAKLAALSVTRAKLAAVGEQTSSTVSAWTTTSSTFSAITNATVTITTTGRPVVLCFQPIGASAGYVGFSRTNEASGGELALYRGGVIQRNSLIQTDAAGVASGFISLPGNMFYVDAVAAGTYTYALYGRVQFASAGSTMTVTNMQLVAYEL